MRVVYFGWYGMGNVGDEMYKVAFPRLFPDQEARFVAALSREAIGDAEALVLGGGNILDRHFMREAVRHAGGVPTYALSVGCTDAAVSREQLEVFRRIWVRDLRSRDRLAGLGVACDYAPDAGWVLEPDRDRGDRTWRSLFAAQGSDLYQRRVVVVLNGHLTTTQPDLLARDQARFQTFADDMVRIIDGTSASFAFVPFGRRLPWDDRVPNAWVAHKCKWHKKNAVVWDGGWDVSQTLDFVAAADAVVSMRLHATVFAMIAGVPFIDVTHHDKNAGFLESVGMTDWGVPYWDFPREATHARLGGLLADGDHPVRATIAGIAAERRDHLATFASGVVFD